MDLKGGKIVKSKKGMRILFWISALCLLQAPVHVFADASGDSKKVISILQQFHLESNSVLSNIMRQLGWGVITGLYWLVRGIESVIYDINGTIGGFFTSDGVVKLEKEKILPITVALFVLVILFIGILSIIKPQNFATIAGNFAVGLVIVVGLPSFLSAAYNLTDQAIAFLDSNSGNGTELLSDRILVNNVTDNTLYDTENFKSTVLKTKNFYQKKSDASGIISINPTELVNPDDMKHPDVWKNKVTSDHDGRQSLTGLGNGTFGFINIPIFSEYYYRWSIDWFTIISTLLITAFALILSGIKIARLLYELAIHQTMAQCLALLDIVTAQRVRKCLQMLLSTFVTLFSVFFMLQLYLLGMSFISNVSNPFLHVLLMVALAWAVIDGPNLFEQLFGIDAGIHSAVRTIYGMKAAGSIVTGGIAALGGQNALNAMRAGGIAGTARHVIRGAGRVAGGVGGIAAGVGKGAADNNQRVSAVRSGMAGAVSGAASGAAAVKAAAARRGGENPEAADGRSQAGNGKNDYPGNSKSTSSKTKAAQETVPPQSENSKAGVSGRNGENAAEMYGKGTSSTGVQSDTLGGYFRSGMARGVKNSGAYQAARHVYSLTRGSMMAHGDKKVGIEQQAYQKMQDNGSMGHHRAVREVKQDIRAEKAQNHLETGPAKKPRTERKYNQEKERSDT
jgi:hypothetical protein